MTASPGCGKFADKPQPLGGGARRGLVWVAARALQSQPGSPGAEQVDGDPVTPDPATPDGSDWRWAAKPHHLVRLDRASAALVVKRATEVAVEGVAGQMAVEGVEPTTRYDSALKWAEEHYLPSLIDRVVEHAPKANGRAGRGARGGRRRARGGEGTSPQTLQRELTVELKLAAEQLFPHLAAAGPPSHMAWENSLCDGTKLLQAFDEGYVRKCKLVGGAGGRTEVGELPPPSELLVLGSRTENGKAVVNTVWKTIEVGPPSSSQPTAGAGVAGAAVGGGPS